MTRLLLTSFYTCSVLIIIVYSVFETVIASHSPNPKHSKVIILGAGISGIAAAEYLYDHGIKDILILEGKNYVGGRIKHVEFAGNLVPLGAGWIHLIGKNNPIWRLSRKHKLKVHYDNYTDFIVRDEDTGEKLKGGHHFREQIRAALERVDTLTEKRMRLGLSDLPLKTSLSMEGWNPTSPLENAIDYFTLDFELALSPAVISSRVYGATGDGQDVIVTDSRGYVHIVEKMAGKFSDRILLDKTVTDVHYSLGENVLIKTKTGEAYSADFVLVTFSSGVLMDNLVKFHPVLPKWKMDSLNMVPMAHYCKAFMKFPDKFWDDHNYIVLASKLRGDYVHWQNFEKKTLFPNQNILLLTVTENECLRMNAMSDEEVIEAAMVKLKKVYGADIPWPTDIMRNHWTSDNFTKGSYPNPVIGITKQVWESIKAPVQTRLWFAGDHAAGEEHYGYVHGAYFSGKVQAGRLAACIKRNRCPKYNGISRPMCIKRED